jgi:hypothetical protein
MNPAQKYRPAMFKNSPAAGIFGGSRHFHFGNVKSAIVGARRLNVPP